MSWTPIGGDGQVWAFIDGHGRLEFGVDLPSQAVRLLGPARVNEEGWLTVNKHLLLDWKSDHTSPSRPIPASYGFHSSIKKYGDGRLNPFDGESLDVGDVVMMHWQIASSDDFHSKEWRIPIIGGGRRIDYHNTVYVTLTRIVEPVDWGDN